jgi:hypothetical protein
MDDSKWERWGALGGILFVVMVVVAAFLPGSPPATNDPTGDMVKFIADKGDQIRYAGYVGALATVPFFWFLGSLWRLLRRAEGGEPRLTVMATLGGVFAGVIGALGGVMLATLPIIGVKTLGPGGVRAFYIFITCFGFTALFGIAIVALASSVVFLRYRAMPTVFGWFGILVAVVALIGGAAAVSTRDAVFTLGFAGFLLASLWVLVLSVLMLRSAPEAA